MNTKNAKTILHNLVDTQANFYTSRHNGKISKDIEGYTAKGELLKDCAVSYLNALEPDCIERLLNVANVDFDAIAKATENVELMNRNIKASKRVLQFLCSLVGAMHKGTAILPTASSRTFISMIVLVSKFGDNYLAKWDDGLTASLLMDDENVENACVMCGVHTVDIGSVGTQKSLCLLMGEIMGVFLTDDGKHYRLNRNNSFVSMLETLANL